MTFQKTKRLFLAAAIAQIIFISFFYFLIDKPSGFSETDIRQYSYSNIILDTDGKLLNVSLSDNDEWCVPVSLDKTGIWTSKVAISLEDKRFYKHKGIDIFAAARAILSNFRTGRTVSGASTITSQLIRIARPRDRTPYNKLLEFWNARKLENILGKDEILELYLNRAPLGGNIRGIEAASSIYFNKRASSLSLGETVTLISMLRAPSKFRPDRYPEKALYERNIKLNYLAARGIISTFEQTHAKEEILSGERYFMPNKASMAAMHVKRENEEKNFNFSSIDSNLQLLLEKNISDAVSEFPSLITGAGIIVENSTGFVRAYVGNSRHGESLPNAQVDCGESLRSPGSTLKPFIYASAFERGLLTPASLLADTPLSFRGSAPRNFDMSYRGPVSARQALASSLNAPAVRTLRMVGYNSAKIILNHFGFTNIDREPQFYTDSLALGGCEVTLIQLAAAYKALSNDGVYSPLRWTLDSKTYERKVLSPEAAYLVTNVLQDERRLLPIYQEIFNEKKMTIAFKTGTSYGLRDAWTAGYSKKYTVVIWLGSPSGVGNTLLVGMEAAAPIFLKVIRELSTDDEKMFSLPDGIGIRLVCSLSGNIPNKYCPQTISDLFILETSNTKFCTMHRNINGRLIVHWPMELQKWISKDDDLTSIKAVKIIRPSEGNTIVLKNINQTERIFLSAEGDTPHYWYIDGKFIGICDSEGLFTDVKPGTHKVTVLSGNASDTVTFYVKTPKEIRNDLYRWDTNILN